MKHLVLIGSALLCVGLGSGCKQGGSSSSVSVDAAAASAADTDPLAKINALIPKDLASTIQFEQVTFEGDANGDGRVDMGETVTAYRPKGWLPFADAHLYPGKFLIPVAPLKPDAGIAEKVDQQMGQSYIEVSTDCDGACSPKPWKPIIDKRMNSIMGDHPDTKDEPLPNGGRIRWGSYDEAAQFGQGPSKHGVVFAAWSNDAASVYPYCEVHLHDSKLLPALPAFAEACRVSHAQWQPH